MEPNLSASSLHILRLKLQEPLNVGMDEFDDIAAIASDTHFPVSIEEAVDAYDKEGVTRLINLWKQYSIPPTVDLYYV